MNVWFSAVVRLRNKPISIFNNRDVFPPLILSLAIIVYFPVCFYGNNQPQPAGKGIPGYCCAIITVNFPPQSPGLFSLSPGAISLCTPGLGSVQQCPQGWRALVLAAELHVQCKSHSEPEVNHSKSNVRWVCTWGRAWGILSSAQLMETPHGSNHWWRGTLNTHLECSTKGELNTDLGFSGSNPADRALFKRDHSTKTLRTLTEAMKWIFLC